jgi:hypothetical protein
MIARGFGIRHSSFLGHSSFVIRHSPAPFKRFTTVWLLATVTALVGVAAFNVLVDPLGSFQSLHLKAFEPLRYLDMDRVAKAEMARRGDWEVIVLGSSRAKAGLPATHLFFQTNRTCNLSFDGAKLPELVAAFDYALQHNPLKYVALFLDLHMFSQGQRWMLDFPESRFNPHFDRFVYYCKELIGRDSTDRSWATLRKYRERYNPPVQSRNGFYDHRLYMDTAQRELFDRVLRIMGAGYSHQTVDAADLELFRHVVRECRDRHIDLQIAIMPVHALDLELLYACGRWPEFEQWKTDLVNVVAAEGVEGEFKLWDFTGYAGPPAEAVPPPGEVTHRMRFYFENSHCTPALGGLMLDAMFCGSGSKACGIKLDRSNIKAHLAQIQEDRTAYTRNNAADIQWVHHIISEVSTNQPAKAAN